MRRTLNFQQRLGFSADCARAGVMKRALMARQAEALCAISVGRLTATHSVTAYCFTDGTVDI